MKSKSKRVFSPEHREKIRLSKLGNSYRRGHTSIPWNKGKKGVQMISIETRQKMSASHLGKTFTEEHREKIRMALSGKRKSNTHRENLRGSRHHSWKGGVTNVRRLIRDLPESRQWRVAVFERDDYTCVFCGVRGGRIQADHIVLFSKIIEKNSITSVAQALQCTELWNIENGQTLCYECHRNKTTNEQSKERTR